MALARPSCGPDWEERRVSAPGGGVFLGAPPGGRRGAARSREPGLCALAAQGLDEAWHGAALQCNPVATRFARHRHYIDAPLVRRWFCTGSMLVLHIGNTRVRRQIVVSLSSARLVQQLSSTSALLVQYVCGTRAVPAEYHCSTIMGPVQHEYGTILYQHKTSAAPAQYQNSTGTRRVQIQCSNSIALVDHIASGCRCSPQCGIVLVPVQHC